MKNLPAFLKRYFWDVDFDRLDKDKFRQFILSRILEYGDERAASWMFKNFRRDEIVKLLSFARLDPKSANFWAVVFDIEKDKILCLQKHYLEIRKMHWPY